MGEAQRLPFPCRKMLIQQIKNSQANGNYPNSSNSEQFFFQSGAKAFSFSNVWIQGHVIDIISNSGDKVIVISDDTSPSQAFVYGVNTILEQNPFLVDTFEKGSYVMVAGRLIEAENNVTIQARRIAQIPTSHAANWPKEVEHLQLYLSKSMNNDNAS